jgi:hypothetical protein
MAKRYEYVLSPHHVDYGVTLDVEDLRVDPQAQRTLNEKRAQDIADEMIREAVGSIVVSKRPNGDMFIVDGMHRWRACQLTGIKSIVAEVHNDLSQQEEAVLFLIKNRESNKPSAIDEYKVGLTAGLPLFIDTEKVLLSRGLSLGSSSANVIGAVSGVLRITDQYGPEILDRALVVAEEAWGRSRDTWDGMLLGGLGMLLGRHGDLVDDSALAGKLAKAGSAQRWIGNVHSVASAGGTQNSGTGSRLSTAYHLMVKEWNKGKSKNKIVL